MSCTIKRESLEIEIELEMRNGGLSSRRPEGPISPLRAEIPYQLDRSNLFIIQWQRFQSLYLRLPCPHRCQFHHRPPLHLSRSTPSLRPRRQVCQVGCLHFNDSNWSSRLNDYCKTRSKTSSSSWNLRTETRGGREKRADIGWSQGKGLFPTLYWIHGYCLCASYRYALDHPSRSRPGRTISRFDPYQQTGHPA
jgi:hypothetical protein